MSACMDINIVYVKQQKQINQGMDEHVTIQWDLIAMFHKFMTPVCQVMAWKPIVSTCLLMFFVIFRFFGLHWITEEMVLL